MFIILVGYNCIISHCYAWENNNHDENLISLSFQQTQTDIILQALADYRQMNLIVEHAIEHKQTVSLHDIDWLKALGIVTKNAKLRYTIDGNLLIINALPDAKQLSEQIKQQQYEQERLLPTQMKILKINHVDLKSLLSIIAEQKILSERGKVTIDERSNSLIINDITKNITEITTLINLIDQPSPQIHISAYIVTMSSESAAELGIKWGYTGSSAQFINQFDINLSTTNAPASIGFNLAKRSGGLLNLELSALEAENQLEIIASPNLLTSNNHTASIKQGTEIPYEVSSGSNGATSIEFKQAVLGLEVTPRILKNNQIELTLHISQNMAGRSIKRSDGGEALAIDTQEIKSQVLVNNGETLILGGIFQLSSIDDKRSVPGVSRVPIIGKLFQYNGKKIQKRELVIFITPNLLNPD